MEQQIAQQQELVSRSEAKTQRYKAKVHKLQSTIMKVGELQEQREQTHRDQTDYITKLLD